MLQVNNLSKAYGPQVLFDSASFTVGHGERVGLVGRNGHGKSTLFRIILGEDHQDSGDIITPNGYRIGHLSQHLVFTKPTVLEEGCLALPRNDEGWDESYKMEAILFGLGFSEEDLANNPHNLSGGYQVRLNLAKVLVAKPNLLLLDEPTNYLDIVSVRWLTRFLQEWEDEFMIITHDRAFMDSVTTHTIGIHRAKVRKIRGTTEDFYRQIEQDEEVFEKTRVNLEKKRKDVEAFVDRFRAKASKAKSVQSKIKALDKMEKLDELADIKSLDFRFNNVPFSGKWPVQIEDLTFGYGEPLISNFSFVVKRDDRIGVIGKNGKGKSTLMNLIAGELRPQSGSIQLHSNLRMGYFGQTNIDRLTPENTVEQEIMQVHPDHSRGVARKICGLMMFEGDFALKRVKVLSGGEKSRVLLGKLLVTPANFLLLDEPTNHLDMYSIDTLIEAIQEFDGAAMIVTHSELILRAVATRLIVFDKGQVSVFEGGYDDFIERVGWQGEEGLAKPRAAKKRSEGNNAAEKELQRQKAELQAESTKAIKKIERRIAQIESEIIKLEASMNESNERIAQAVEINDSATISKLSWTIHEMKQSIDSLFAELETLDAEKTAREKDTEQRISAALLGK